MRRICKSYLVFTGFGYRLAVFGLIPLFLLGIQVLVVFRGGDGSIPLLLALAGMEAAADSWFLGGIQSKEAEKMDFLKTSAKGMQVLQNALTMDLLRRFFSLAGMLLLCSGIAWLGGGRAAAAVPFWKYVFPLLFGYVLSVLATWSGRFCSTFWVNMVISYLVLILGLVGTILVMRMPVRAVVLLNLTLAALGILCSALTVRTAMNKVEGSCFDRRERWFHGGTEGEIMDKKTKMLVIGIGITLFVFGVIFAWYAGTRIGADVGEFMYNVHH